MPGPVDVALISLGTTPGLRRADSAFAGQLRAAGLDCVLQKVDIGVTGALRRNPAVTDLVEALAARRAAAGMHAQVSIFSTVTAALAQPRRGPYAVRFDSPAALNRPGVSGGWQRRLERRALSGASLLLPWSVAAGNAAPGASPRVVLPVPIPAGEHDGPRDIDAFAYAGYPEKRGLDILIRAWSEAGAGRRLVIGGIERERALDWLGRKGLDEPRGVEWRGPVPHDEWLATVSRAKLFVNASRWEDYGISQLEALSAGAALVTVPSAGPYEALGLARRLASELVDDRLHVALAAGLAMEAGQLAAYRKGANEALEPYRPAAVQAIVEEQVLPSLGLAP